MPPAKVTGIDEGNLAERSKEEAAAAAAAPGSQKVVIVAPLTREYMVSFYVPEKFVTIYDYDSTKAVDAASMNLIKISQSTTTTDINIIKVPVIDSSTVSTKLIGRKVKLPLPSSFYRTVTTSGGKSRTIKHMSIRVPALMSINAISLMLAKGCNLSKIDYAEVGSKRLLIDSTVAGLPFSTITTPKWMKRG